MGRKTKPLSGSSTEGRVAGRWPNGPLKWLREKLENLAAHVSIIRSNGNGFNHADELEDTNVTLARSHLRTALCCRMSWAAEEQVRAALRCLSQAEVWDAIADDHMEDIMEINERSGAEVTGGMALVTQMHNRERPAK